MSKFDLRDYMKNNKIDLGKYTTTENDGTFKANSDIRKTNYDVKILEDGKLDLYTHKKILAEGRRKSLNEKSYNTKTDLLNAYFKGDISVEKLNAEAENMGTSVATKKELDDFLKNKFLQDMMSDTHGISSSQLVKKVKELKKHV